MAVSEKFVAFGNEVDAGFVVAVDLGYSSNLKTCGIACSGSRDEEPVTFGQAIDQVAELLDNDQRDILVIEAVLSTVHSAAGNPTIRGDFERGRGWYYGAGAVTALAARRFLQQLAARLSAPVLLAEAFLSNKTFPTGHCDDACVIADSFWDTSPAELVPGTEPLLSCIRGVPSVRVFQQSDVTDAQRT